MSTEKQMVGRIGEKLVEIELLKKKINFWDPGENNPFFDLIIETKKGLKKVQIKTSLNNKNFKRKWFQFYLKNCQDKYNFLICVCMFDKEGKKNTFFIIPNKSLISKKGKKLTGINFIIGEDKIYKKFENKWKF